MNGIGLYVGLKRAGGAAMTPERGLPGSARRDAHGRLKSETGVGRALSAPLSAADPCANRAAAQSGHVRVLQQKVLADVQDAGVTTTQVRELSLHLALKYRLDVEQQHRQVAPGNT